MKHNTKKLRKRAGRRRKNIPAENKKDVIVNTPVLNLSGTILSTPQIPVWSKGLNFSPTNKFNLFMTLMDINRFARPDTKTTFL